MAVTPRLPLSLAILSALVACGDEMAGLDPVLNSESPQECWVSGTPSLESILVSPQEGEAFFVGTYDMESKVRVPLPEEEHGAAEVRVAGAIAFSGELAQPAFSIVADVESAQGMVHIRPGTYLNWSHIAPGGVRGVVSGSVPSHFWKTPDQLGPITVPCAALSLDQLEGEFELPDSSASDGTRWVLKDSPLLDDDWGADEDDQEENWLDDNYIAEADDTDELYFQELLRDGARPTLLETALLSQYADGSGEAVEVASDHLVFERVAEDNGWMQVESHLGGGLVTGWLPSADVAQLHELFGFGGGGFGSSSCCGMRFGFLGTDVYRGPATFREGARIFATQDTSAAWGTVAGGETTFQVEHAEGDDWVKITHIPGLVSGCGDQRHAFIPVDDVYFPQE